MFDPLSLLFVAVLAFQGGAPDTGFDETRAVIIDTGAPAPENPPPPPQHDPNS